MHAGAARAGSRAGGGGLAAGGGPAGQVLGRYLAECEERLSTAQSKKDKLPKGSPERRKAAKKVCHIYERLGNIRDNFAHQLSRDIVDEYGIISMEDIDITNMIEKKPYLARSILDASWSRFRIYVM